MSESDSLRVLIVCLGRVNDLPYIAIGIYTLISGNICRSPMGEAVLRDVAKKRGISIVVDSCGTAAYHVGEDPDDR